jgi:hypothetical protein
MEIVLKSRLLTSKEIALFSYCQHFLEVYTISDISKANGQYVDEAYHCHQPTHTSFIKPSDGTTSFFAGQLDSLNNVSRSTSLPHNNGIVHLFGPRTSHWLYGNYDGQSGSIGMKYYIPDLELQGSQQEH